MSHFGPYTTAVGLLERTPHRVDLMLRDQPGILGYRLWGHRRLNDAYGNPVGSKVGGAGPVPMIDVDSGAFFRSETIVRRRWPMIEESTRGMARVLFDPDDYVSDPITDLPSDDQVLFLRVQERPATTGDWNVVAPGLVNAASPILGPIYVVPAASFFGMPSPALSLQGIAPANTGSVGGGPPDVTIDGQEPNPMHVILPRFTKTLRILNTSASNDLLVAFGLGDTMASLGPGEETFHYGGVKELVLAGSDNSGGGADGTPFSIQAVIAVGPD